MSDNGGAKDHNDTPLSTTELGQHSGTRDNVMPSIQGHSARSKLRGKEANTDESKGETTPLNLVGTKDGEVPECT
jgi:hypothetical protein